MSKFNYRVIVALRGRNTTQQLLDEYDQASLIFLNTNVKQEREIFRTIGNICQYILSSRGIVKDKLTMALLKHEEERNDYLLSAYESQNC
jgi:bacterioferritin (cytochrome b1)